MSKAKIADLDEVLEGQMIMRMHDDVQVLLARVGGEIYAMNDVCTHEGAPLHEGRLGAEENPCLLTCPWHEAHFDLRSGTVYQETPWATDTETYSVSIENGEIYVELEED